MADSLICPRCGAPNPPGSQSCANCGWAPPPLVQQPGAPQGYGPPPYGSQAPQPGPQPYSPSQSYGQDQSYGQHQPYDAGGGGRRLLLIIVPIAVAVAVVAALAVIFVPRVLRGRNQPVPPPAATSSKAPTQPTAAPPPPKPTAPQSTKPPTIDYSQLGPKVSSGILKIIATGCPAGSRIGSAFLIGRHTAVASLSSLAGADVIGLSNGNDSFAATVFAADLAHGIVILTLDHAAGGHVFAVDSTHPATGDPVGTFGVPASGSQPSLAQSTIGDTNARVTIGSTPVTGLAATQATVDAGLSGAPTLAANGHANGMVLLDASNQMMIVSGETIKSATSQAGGTLPHASCQRTLGPNLTPIGGSAAGATNSLFTQYFGGINSGHYHTAFNQLSQQLRSTGYQNYAKGWATSYDFNIVVHQATGSGAYVTFDSIFARGKGPKGTKTCARWDIDYQFVTESGRPVIAKALPHSGSIFRRC